MSAASTLNFKVECLLDGKLVSFVQRFAPSDLVSTVLQVAATQLSLNPSEWNVCRDPGGTQVLAPSTTLESHCFPKSTKIYLGKIGGQTMVSVVAAESSAPPALPPLDPVDVLLNQEHDKKFLVFTCADKSAVTTVDQVPVDPWDERVRGREQRGKDQDKEDKGERALLKMPFHAWLAQIAVNRAQVLRHSTIRDLDVPKFRETAKDKASRTVTTQKDLAVTSHVLRPQVYRHVDQVQFENPGLLRHIIDLATGYSPQQRVAWLYGTYEKITYIPAVKASKSEAAKDAQGFPLGIRALVKAVFEPKQTSSKVHIHFPQEGDALALTDLADKIASAAGLKRVGWLFTDIERDAHVPNRYLEKRHAGTYFLKPNELALAAHLQGEFPSRCDYAECGYAGSKFCTVVLSGGRTQAVNNIEPSVYQVSDVATHFVKQNIFVNSGRSDQMKVVQGDPEVALKFEWEIDKVGAAKGVHSYMDSSQTNGLIPSDTFLVPIPACAPGQATTALFQRNDPQWICTRDDFDQSNQRRNLANRVWRLYEGHMSSAREELCDFNLLVYAASLGVDLKEVQALTEELVKPVFNEEVVRVLLGSESWLTFVSTNMS